VPTNVDFIILSERAGPPSPLGGMPELLEFTRDSGVLLFRVF